MKSFAQKISIAVALLFFAIPMRAAVVHLNDGSRLTGTVVSATAREVQLHTPDGLLKIGTDRIARIDYADVGEPPAPPPPTRETADPGGEWDERRSLAGARQQFSIDFGLAAPVSRVKFSSVGGGSTDNGDPGPQLGAQYLYKVAPRWGAGFAVQYFNRGRAGGTGLIPFADTSIGGNTLMLLALGKYSFLKTGSARPYVAAGIGTNRTSTVIDATPVAGFAWSDTDTDETRRLVDDSHWGLAYTARLGIDFRADEPSFFAFELGFTGLDNAGYEANQSGLDLGLTDVTGSISAFTVAGRWGWRF